MIVLIVLSTAASLWALHSPSTLFEMSKRFTLTGTVTDVDWVNPHIEVFIDARGGSGTEWWKFESNPPAWFRRAGVGRVDFAEAIGKPLPCRESSRRMAPLTGTFKKSRRLTGVPWD